MKAELKGSSLRKKIKSAKTKQLLTKVAAGNEIAINQLIDKYGNQLWTFARKFTDDDENAEQITRKNFRNIWIFAESFNSFQITEQEFVEIIAAFCLVKSGNKTKFE